MTVAAAWGRQRELYLGGKHALYRGDYCREAWVRVYEPPVRTDGAYSVQPIWSLAAGSGGRVYFGSGEPYAVHVSDDGGGSWRITGLSGEVGSLVVSPSDPDVAYVFGRYTGAMSEARSWIHSVFRTTNAGRTWEEQTRHKPVGFPAIDPGDPSTVYLLSYGRVLRSTDGATSFEEYGVYNLGAVPSADGRLRDYFGRAAMSIDGSRMWFIGIAGGMYLSRDRGVAWERLPDVPFGGPVRSISASPHDPRVVFAVAQGDELWAYREPVAEPTMP